MPAELDQALKANPDDVDALHMLMRYHHYAGEYATAHRLAERILERLPLFWPTRWIVGDMLREQGDLTGAIRELGKVLEQDAQNAIALGVLARTHLDSGDVPRARQSLERVSQADRQAYYVRLISAIQLAREGHHEKARKEMDEQVLKWGTLVAWANADLAAFYAVLGDAPKALEWLDLAVRHGDERAEWFRRDPLLATIRDHPRFEQILQSIAYRRQQRKPLG